MKTMAFAAFALVAFAALADLDTISLDGTWDFAFARGANAPARVYWKTIDKPIEKW